MLRATLPAGTLSGAPKIRAMEIIDELEPVQARRLWRCGGLYLLGGRHGYRNRYSHSRDKDGKLYVQAGGGVVADSIPVMEWRETMTRPCYVSCSVHGASRGE